jgi:hypothetical protein
MTRVFVELDIRAFPEFVLRGGVGSVFFQTPPPRGRIARHLPPHSRTNIKGFSVSGGCKMSYLYPDPLDTFGKIYPLPTDKIRNAAHPPLRTNYGKALSNCKQWEKNHVYINAEVIPACPPLVKCMVKFI